MKLCEVFCNMMACVASGSQFCGTPVTVNSVSWKKASSGEVPTGAVCAGKATTGELVYVGRMKLEENKDELTPGVIVPSHKCIYASFGTGVRQSIHYEVLVTADPSHVSWIPCKDGYVPQAAVIGGIDSSYLEPLYVGRTNVNLSAGRTWRGQRFPQCHNKVSVPGKVQRSHKCLYIPFERKEYIFRQYDVLTLTSSPAPLMHVCVHALKKHIASISFAENDDSADSRTSNDMNILPDFHERINRLPIPPSLKKLCLR